MFKRRESAGRMGVAGDPTHARGHQDRSRLTRRRRRLRTMAVVTVVALVALAEVGYAVARLQGNVGTLNAFGALGDRPAGSPAGSSQPINILVMGSDSRAGANAALGGADQGARSDTVILLHVAGDRKSATAVSIPRDSMVQVPACPLDGGKSTSSTFEQFNTAFAVGGPTCTIKTVESLTGSDLITSR